MNHIIVVSHEGGQSYTEVNFFNGILNYFKYYNPEKNITLNFIVKASQYIKCNSSHMSTKWQMIKLMFSDRRFTDNFENTSSDNSKDVFYVFIVADKDKPHNMNAINCTTKNTIEMFQNYFNSKQFKHQIHEQILCEENKNFDWVLNGMFKNIGKLQLGDIKSYENTRLFYKWYTGHFGNMDDQKIVLNTLVEKFKGTSYEIFFNTLQKVLNE